MDDIEVLVPNDTEFEFVTPTQTYIIKTGIKMSEDGDEPETDYNFYSPMTSYGLDDQHKTMVNQMTTTTTTTFPSNSTFWVAEQEGNVTSIAAGGYVETTAPHTQRIYSNDTWQFETAQLKTITFNNIKWECYSITLDRSVETFLPVYSTVPNYNKTQHTLKINNYDFTWGTSDESYYVVKIIYDKTTDTLYGIQNDEGQLSGLENSLTGDELLYLNAQSPVQMVFYLIDDPTKYIILPTPTEQVPSYFCKLEHAAVYITELQEL